MWRRVRAVWLGIVFLSSPVAAQLAPDHLPRQQIVINDIPGDGWILDIGGGCRGTIGRIKPKQVVAIDISSRELREAPSDLLKIEMDAADLKFLDQSFSAETAFFSLLFMPPTIHRKVFSEAFRVLKSGAVWSIWDTVVPAKADGVGGKRLDVYLSTKLPQETIEYGYSIDRYAQKIDAAYYVGLAKECGFQVVRLKEDPGPRHTFFLELKRP